MDSAASGWKVYKAWGLSQLEGFNGSGSILGLFGLWRLVFGRGRIELEFLLALSTQIHPHQQRL